MTPKALATGPFSCLPTREYSTLTSEQDELVGIFRALFAVSSTVGSDVLILLVRYRDDVDLPRSRHRLFNLALVGFGAFLAGAKAQVNRILRHLEAKVEKLQTEARRGFALFLGTNRKIEQDDEPHDAITR